MVLLDREINLVTATVVSVSGESARPVGAALFAEDKLPRVCCDLHIVRARHFFQASRVYRSGQNKFSNFKSSIS